jgi:hypothetical protein
VIALDVDTSVLERYGLREGAERGYNPRATRALWSSAHQSFALRSWVSTAKFGPSRVVCRTPLANVRITSFFAREHEVRVIDPSRVTFLDAVGCDVRLEDR